MHINPFNPYFPAHDELFANRRKEQELFRRALTSSTQSSLPGAWNVAIVGPWGIGKTSLLRRFAWMASQHDPPVGVVAMTATTAISGFDGFARSLLWRIQRDLSGNPRLSERIQAELAKWEPKIQLGPVSMSRRTSKEMTLESGVDLLYAELSRLWKQYVVGRLAAVFVFIDDANNLLEIDNKALLSLRAVFQDLQGQGMVYPLVITGPEDMFEATRDVSEPVTRFFERTPIGPFSREDTAEAILEPLRAVNHPIDITPDAIDAVYARTLGHPYFVAFAMRELINQADVIGIQKMDEGFVVNNWSLVSERLGEEKFEAEWNHATDAERDVLASVANNLPVSHNKRSGAALAARLVKKGLLIKRGRGKYALYHPLFAEYIRARRQSAE